MYYRTSNGAGRPHWIASDTRDQKDLISEPQPAHEHRRAKKSSRAIKSTVTKVSGTERAVRSTYSAGEEVLRCVALTYLSATDLAAQPPQPAPEKYNQRRAIHVLRAREDAAARLPAEPSTRFPAQQADRQRPRTVPPSAQADDL